MLCSPIVTRSSVLLVGGDWYDWRLVPGHPRRAPAHRGGIAGAVTQDVV